MAAFFAMLAMVFAAIASWLYFEHGDRHRLIRPSAAALGCIAAFAFGLAVVFVAPVS